MSPVLLRYRGREIGAEATRFIQQLIDQNPGLSRRRLSVELCRAWNWTQANGQWRDMVARSLMLQLHLDLPRFRGQGGRSQRRKTD
ncbi:MAG: hypothetical protein H7A47_00975 [Verrucomicrobiales bacterium]|nr:hypothetical protein [Verrucomicrobiales bacterium]